MKKIIIILLFGVTIILTNLVFSEQAILIKEVSEYPDWMESYNKNFSIPIKYENGRIKEITNSLFKVQMTVEKNKGNYILNLFINKKYKIGDCFL